MNSTKLREIRIEQAERQRPQRSFWGIIIAVLGITLVALIFAWPKKSDSVRIVSKAAPAAKNQLAQTAPLPTPAPTPNEVSGAVLTVSGYIVNHERIELSPRFPGVVNWIGAKKGDRVSKGSVVVLLDDAEQRARVLEAEGRVASAKARLEKAQLAYDRAKRLRENRVESQQLEDDARVEVSVARAAIKEAEGGLAYAQTQLEWTQIRSPIDGVVLEKLTEPGELVMPQSFGGTRGPSTAVLAVADPNDLQVEIDVNESDLSKITLGQRCRVSPEAYSEKSYGGYVIEIAPEANRQKGTLQVKVQIENPDRFLTPELSARVDFLH